MAKQNIKNTDPHNTPMMRQYLAIKEQFPDAILFYRMGDFYEMFFEDAVVAAQSLDLTLTSRNKKDPNPIPMCGIPHHASVGYISRLIESGYKVAICDQMEDPLKVKGLVKREVVRVVTPGVVFDEENLDAKANNFLAAVLPVFSDEDSLGKDSSGENSSTPISIAVAVFDASTNEFRGTKLSGMGSLAGEIYRLEPREILIAESSKALLKDLGGLLPKCYVTVCDDDLFAKQNVLKNLEPVIGKADATTILFQNDLLARAASAAAGYVQSTRPKDLPLATRFVAYDVNNHMIIDEATKSHLELTRTSDGQKKGSLLWLLDNTKTGMGGRTLRNWINYPLCDVSEIKKRQEYVDLFFQDTTFRNDVRETLSAIADIERITAKIGLKAATPRDLGVLRNSLAVVPHLDDLITSCHKTNSEEVLGTKIDRVEDLCDGLTDALVNEPPVSIKDGGIFKEGFDKHLDELTSTLKNAKDFVASLETKEKKRSGISSLKVSYNRVFGYFIYITKPNLKHVPQDYIRKQTLANGERFVTKELEEWETKILSADERRRVLEIELYNGVLTDLCLHITRLLVLSRKIAKLDCASALAETARTRDFVRPKMNNSGIIDIKEGRHPLVEALQSKTAFVPNNIKLDPKHERLLIITGPNMAGKSTVMRQVAIISILAQMGSFVPANSAKISLCDRLFTRVGASDNIARGASTFMVEMNETSSILRSATSSSLVILDEVGRGTSTFDGLSIAWAVGEYLHDFVKCKVMFATHYHELVELANVKQNAANYHVAAREYGDEVVFLRKLVKGGTSHSFGIQVAKMAGLPEIVVHRAREILCSLEDEHPSPTQMPNTAKHSPQLDLFAATKPSEVEKLLEEIDINRITPLEAISLLSKMKTLIK